MNIGQKILELRKTKGWSQEELASQISVSRQALSKWELGTAIPDSHHVLKLSQLFLVSTDFLLDDSLSDFVSPTNVHSEHLREKINQRKLIGLGMIALSGITFFALVIVSIYKPHHVQVNSRLFTGFRGFIMGYQLTWFLGVLIALAVLGLGVIYWPWVKQVPKK